MVIDQDQVAACRGFTAQSGDSVAINLRVEFPNAMITTRKGWNDKKKNLSEAIIFHTMRSQKYQTMSYLDVILQAK